LPREATVIPSPPRTTRWRWLGAVPDSPAFQILHNECQRQPRQRILVEDRHSQIILEAQVVDQVADGGGIRRIRRFGIAHG